MIVCLFVFTDAQERQIDIATLRKEHPAWPRGPVIFQGYNSRPRTFLLFFFTARCCCSGREETGKNRINKNPAKTLSPDDLQCSPSRSILTPHMLPLQTTVPGTHSLGSIMTVVYVGIFWVYLLAFSLNQGSGVYYLFDIVSICVYVALTNAHCRCVWVRLAEVHPICLLGSN